MTEFTSDKQQLIELLQQVIEIAQRLEHHSMVAIVEHWIDMLENNPRWWIELSSYYKADAQIVANAEMQERHR